MADKHQPEEERRIPAPGEPAPRNGHGAEPGRGMGSRSEPDEEGPVGPFPSWKWVYGSVLAYGALVIIALWILTRILDPGVTP